LNVYFKGYVNFLQCNVNPYLLGAIILPITCIFTYYTIIILLTEYDDGEVAIMGRDGFAIMLE
ncbi:hypothetical protein, partial [Akkermansia sp.]|uniref:hypothetical protein n=1 Tax=Akkermansia sp. TaxID=1872421 RepID=UPI003A946042